MEPKLHTPKMTFPVPSQPREPFTNFFRHYVYVTCRPGNVVRYRNNDVDDLRSPVETAIAHRNDVIALLVALGANVNVGLKHGVTNDYYRQGYLSVMDWVRLAIPWLSDRISKAGDTNVPKPSSKADANCWNDYHQALLEGIKAIREKQSRLTAVEDTEKTLHGLLDIRDYLCDVEDLLLLQHAQTWDDIYPDRKSDSTAGQLLLQRSTSTSRIVYPTQYSYPTHRHHPTSAPQHLITTYDELYEACFTGDNEKIKQLCLPPEGSTIEPLQISVQTCAPKNGENNVYSSLYWAEYTPLFVAIARRHWETARLILAIAVAQYHPKEDDKGFSIRDLVLGASKDVQLEMVLKMSQ
jgi:hypothetical protein